MRSCRATVLFALIIFGWLSPAGLRAENEDAYPSRPVTIVVPFAAGGGADLNARTVAERLTLALGQPFIVDNKPGASGNIGTAFVARAPADGYTLLMSNSGALTVNPHLYGEPGYDALKDFAPISLAVKISNLLVVHPSVPVRTLGEFIAYAKANPGLFYGHSSGSKLLSGEVFRAQAGIDMPPVAYKGSAPMMADLLGGHIKVGFDEVLTSMPYVQSGKLRALATTGSVRWPALPEIPPIAEFGGQLTGYEVTGWFGLLAPAATPPAIVERLSKVVMNAFADKDFRQKLYDQGVEPVGSSSEEFKTFIGSEYRRWGELIHKLGIKAD
jgi:tripartite-type tricarboxylate transporter receptor subunit TctC